MSLLVPYSGSLLRLTLTLAAVIAIFAAVFASWQETHARHGHTSAATTEMTPAGPAH